MAEGLGSTFLPASEEGPLHSSRSLTPSLAETASHGEAALALRLHVCPLPSFISLPGQRGLEATSLFVYHKLETSAEAAQSSSRVRTHLGDQSPCFLGASGGTWGNACDGEQWEVRAGETDTGSLTDSASTAPGAACSRCLFCFLGKISAMLQGGKEGRLTYKCTKPVTLL